MHDTYTQMTNKRNKIANLRIFCEWIRRNPKFVESRIMTMRHSVDEEFGNYLTSYYFGNGYTIFTNKMLNTLGANIRRAYTKKQP